MPETRGGTAAALEAGEALADVLTTAGEALEAGEAERLRRVESGASVGSSM